MRRQSDQALSIFFSVITAYASYILAEELHVSGVLAAVASGIFSGWNAHRALDAGTRLSAVAFWGVMIFGLEALLFVLLGLQAPQVADEVDVGSLALQALAVVGAVIAVRMAVTLGLGGGGSRTPCASASRSAGPECAARSRSPRRSRRRARSRSGRRSCCSRSASSSSRCSGRA